jgi:hypothetical protein
MVTAWCWHCVQQPAHRTDISACISVCDMQENNATMVHLAQIVDPDSGRAAAVQQQAAGSRRSTRSCGQRVLVCQVVVVECC